MNINEVKVNTKSVAGKSRIDLLVALKEIMSFDLDFTGQNGDEYLWEVAKAFPTNLSYTLNEVKSLEPDDMVNRFFSIAMLGNSYYKFVDWKTDKDNDGNITAIAVAYGV